MPTTKTEQRPVLSMLDCISMGTRLLVLGCVAWKKPPGEKGGSFTDDGEKHMPKE